VSPIKFQM